MGNVLEFKPVGQDEKDADLDVRVLTPEEVESLRPEFEARGAIFPNPSSSYAVGAVDPDGKVTDWLFVQLQVHAEPMRLEHPVLFKRVVATAERTLLERCGPCLVYTFTPAGKITQLAQAAGMQIEPWVVMSKIVATPPEEVH